MLNYRWAFLFIFFDLWEVAFSMSSLFSLAAHEFNEFSPLSPKRQTGTKEERRRTQRLNSSFEDRIPK